MIISRAKYEALQQDRDSVRADLDRATAEIELMRAELSRLYGYEADRDKVVARLQAERDNYAAEAAELSLRLRDTERTAHDFDGRLSILHREVEWLRGQLAAKDEAILTMKREGFAPPAPTPPTPERPDESLPLEVRKAIEKVADPGSALWMEEVKRARRELAFGRDGVAIAADIERGSTLNPFHA